LNTIHPARTATIETPTRSASRTRAFILRRPTRSGARSATSAAMKASKAARGEMKPETQRRVLQSRDLPSRVGMRRPWSAACRRPGGSATGQAHPPRSEGCRRRIESEKPDRSPSQPALHHERKGAVPGDNASRVSRDSATSTCPGTRRTVPPPTGTAAIPALAVRPVIPRAAAGRTRPARAGAPRRRRREHQDAARWRPPSSAATWSERSCWKGGVMDDDGIHAVVPRQLCGKVVDAR